MEKILLIDYGSTFTKVTAVEPESGTIIGNAKAFTTIDTDISDGLRCALESLQFRIGKINYSERLACSSAAGGLRMVAVGLVPELTANAAKKLKPVA